MPLIDIDPVRTACNCKSISAMRNIRPDLSQVSINSAACQSQLRQTLKNEQWSGEEQPVEAAR